MALALAVFACVIAPAAAQYPAKPIRVFLPFGPGGIGDVTLRLVTGQITERSGIQFVIENRPGAGGITSAMAAKTAPPDGYTLALLGNSAAIGASLFASLPFDAIKDFAPISVLAQFDILLATKSSGPLTSVAKLIEIDRANPGKLNFGSIAAGSTQNLAADMFKIFTGSKAEVVTFKTSQDLLLAVQRGDIDVAFDYLAAFAPSIGDGQVRIIGSGGERRSPLTPDTPTLVESGMPDYIVSSWNGLSAPAGTPREAIDRLNREINAVLNLPSIKTRVATLGMDAAGTTPEGALQRLVNDTERWRVIIEKLGLRKQ